MWQNCPNDHLILVVQMCQNCPNDHLILVGQMCQNLLSSYVGPKTQGQRQENVVPNQQSPCTLYCSFQRYVVGRTVSSAPKAVRV